MTTQIEKPRVRILKTRLETLEADSGRVHKLENKLQKIKRFVTFHTKHEKLYPSKMLVMDIVDELKEEII